MILDVVLLVTPAVPDTWRLKVSLVGHSERAVVVKQYAGDELSILMNCSFLPVARSDFYGFPADVYSFAILLWEVCTLDKPFAGMSKQEHLEMVVGAQVRPKLSAVMASSGLKKLLQSCWSDDPIRRPPFGEILNRVRSEIDLRDAPHRSFKRDRIRQRRHRGESIDSKLSMSLPSDFDKTVALNRDTSP